MTILQSLALSLRRIVLEDQSTVHLNDKLCSSRRRRCLRKQDSQSTTILERWYADKRYRGSLAEHDIGEKEIMFYDRIAFERRDYTATRAERNAKHWVLRLNADGHQKPIRQRQDFADALKRCVRKLRLLCRSQDLMAVLQRATGKPPAASSSSSSTSQRPTSQWQTSWSSGNLHHLRNGGDFGVDSTPINTAHTVQCSLFTSAERIARA